MNLPSDPPLFSEPWWKLTGWFMQECKQRGIAVSLSDYTLGIGQGWSVDEMLAANPDLNGFTLAHESKPIQAGSSSADRVRRARDSTSSSPMNSASVSAADAGPY